jgi:serine phosphatase RsbU (regulator of sigma subunit)
MTFRPDRRLQSGRATTVSPPVRSLTSPPFAQGTGQATALAEVSTVPAVRELQVLARLPAQIIHARTSRELAQLVEDAIVTLFGVVGRFELFAAERPAGGLVPTGEPRDGLALLGMVTAGGEGLERARLLPQSSVHQDLLSVPLSDRGGLLGLLVVEAARERRFIATNLEVLAAIGAQIALALQRLAIETRDAEHRRLERDMVLAREVQRRFLPGPPPPEHGLRMVAHYRPAYDVGGDFYDLIFHGPPGSPITAVIGDVAGKGVPAALLMSRVSSDLHRLALQIDSPAELLVEVDRTLAADETSDSFVTLAVCRFEPARQRVVVANAGHVPPILRRAGGSVLAFGRASGPPLGMGIDGAWSEQGIALAPGDSIFLMTDGLAEALDRPGDRMGTKLLSSLIGDDEPSLDTTCHRVLAAVERERLMRSVDDVTLVALQFDPR